MTVLDPSRSPQEVYTKQYFNLRLTHDISLIEFKKIQKETKKELITKVKKIQGVSKQRIEQSITIFKKVPLSTPEDVYNFIESSISQTNYMYYRNNRSNIIEFISNIFKLNSDLRKYKNTLKKELTLLKKQNKTCNITVLDHMYSKFKKDLDTYMKYGADVETYQKMIKSYSFAEDILNDMFVEEAKKHESKLIEEKEQKNESC